MGVEALIHNDAGELCAPATADDWREWISASALRNFMLEDPLIDWLDEYGAKRGYIRKQDAPDYDARLDFGRFIMNKGQEFQAAIIALLKERIEICEIARNSADIRDFKRARETFDAMERGAEAISEGVLWDAEHKMYGAPDLLMRSDVLHRFFPDGATEMESHIAAPGLRDGRHYVVVDIKYATIAMNAKGSEVANIGSLQAYKAQLHIYNRALGRIQGYLPPRAFLLGRGWLNKNQRVENAFDRLLPVQHYGDVANGRPIAGAVAEGAIWLRRLRAEGGDWTLDPAPSTRELYPNMSRVDSGDIMPDEDSRQTGEDGVIKMPDRWVSVKRDLGARVKELTALWQVGAKRRIAAHDHGVYRWDEPGLQPENVGIKGAKQAPVLAKILAVNAPDGKRDILPARIKKTRDEWRAAADLEFFVDFEFCSDLDDDFSALPNKGGQPIIFMIGCGHMEEGEWRFSSFVVNDLNEDEEYRVITEWTAHMALTADRLGVRSEPRLFHWSPAEVSALERAHNSARVRHVARADWPEDLGWLDFYKIMEREPIVVRGALGFGLKAVAKAFHALGYIQTDWGDSQVDGLGAMVGAWSARREARERGVSMADVDLMREIAEYNEVDCKAMMEIIAYLRDNH